MIGVLSATAVVFAVPVSATATAARRVPCQTVAVSPAFATDRTMFCASGASESAGFRGPVNLYKSTDAGRTWSAPMRVASSGGGDMAEAIFVSPAYPTDHTIFVGTHGAGYVSTDDGRTFVQLSNIGNFNRYFASVYLDGLPGPAVTRPALVAAGGIWPCCDMVYDPLTTPVTRPVVPPPDYTLVDHYLVPPDFASSRQAVALGRPNLTPASPDYGTLTGHSKAYACDAHFVCNRVLYDLAPAPGETDSYVDFAGTTFDGGRDTYVVTSGDPDRARASQRMFRSRDSGRTWAPWDSVNALLRGLPWGTFAYAAASPERPTRLFLRISGWAWDTESAPQEQVFRSDDDGRTWRRTGFAWGPEQRPRTRSTLPWNLTHAYEPLVVRGDRVFVVGEHASGKRTDATGLYCSANGGASWSRSC